MNSTAEGNEFVHFDEYEDAVVAISGGIARRHGFSISDPEISQLA